MESVFFNVMKIKNKICKLVVLIILLGCFQSAFAKDLTSIGIGNTKEEALTNARINIIQSVSVQVLNTNLYTDFTSISTNLTNNSSIDEGSKTETIKSITMEMSSFDLLGKIEDVIQLDDKSWKATCIIPESSLSLYIPLVNDIYNSIKTLYDSTLKTTDDKILIDLYTSIIVLFKKYDAYKSVCRILDSNVSIPFFENISKMQIEAQYQAILQRKIQKSEITIDSVMQQSEIGIVSVVAQNELKKAQEELKIMRAAQEELRNQSDLASAFLHEQYKQEMVASIKLMQDNYLKKANSFNEEKTIIARINQIEASRLTFKAIKDDIETKVIEIENKYNEELDDELEVLKNKPYRSSELYNNEPTEEAINWRSEESKLIAEELRSKYLIDVNMIIDKMLKPMNKISDYVCTSVDNINLENYQISSFSDEVSCTIDYFVQAKNCWVGTVIVTLGTQEYIFSFEIPYTNWTDKKVSKKSDGREAYNKYLDDVDDWSLLFSQFPSALQIILNCSLEVSSTESTYKLIIDSYDIKRMTDNKIIYHDKSTDYKLLRFQPSIDVCNYDFVSNIFGTIKRKYIKPLLNDSKKNIESNKKENNIKDNLKSDTNKNESLILSLYDSGSIQLTGAIKFDNSNIDNQTNYHSNNILENAKDNKEDSIVIKENIDTLSANSVKSVGAKEKFYSILDKYTDNAKFGQKRLCMGSAFLISNNELILEDTLILKFDFPVKFSLENTKYDFRFYLGIDSKSIIDSEIFSIYFKYTLPFYINSNYWLDFSIGPGVTLFPNTNEDGIPENLSAFSYKIDANFYAKINGSATQNENLMTLFCGIIFEKDFKYNYGVSFGLSFIGYKK